MKREIVFGEALYERLRAHLLKSAPDEEAAVVLAGQQQLTECMRLLVREFHPVPASGFARRSGLFLAVDPVWYGPLLKRCREEGWSFLLAHSHPFSRGAHFSGTDDAGEQELMPRLFQRAPDRAHGSIVFGSEFVDARAWLPTDTEGLTCQRVLVRGRRSRDVLTRFGSTSQARESRFDRQVRALGDNGQRQLRAVHVGLVGLGGIGSHVYQQLKYLGIRQVTLVDCDRIEESNLNRLTYATPNDLGALKVDVASRRGREILPDSDDQALCLDVRSEEALRALSACDIIVLATDNLVSRLTVNRLLTQYLVPIIDAGLDIDAHDGHITAIGGRITRLVPDGPCLSCLGIAGPARVAAEVARTYISGEEVAAPSVVSLNGVIASIAVNELLDHVTGYSGELPELPRSYVYDGRRGFVRAVQESATPCGVCTLVYAAADVEPLPRSESTPTR